MATQAHITRRAAIVGAFASSAAIALPAVAAVQDANLRPAPLAAHHALFVVEGVQLLVDTEDLPTTYTERDADGVGRPTQFLHSVPDEGARYLVVTSAGELAVTPLCAGQTMLSGPNRRRGMVLETATPRMQVRTLVTVIGKVLTEEA